MTQVSTRFGYDALPTPQATELRNTAEKICGRTAAKHRATRNQTIGEKQMTYHSEHLMRQAKRKLFVEQAVWECIEKMTALALETNVLGAFEDEEDFVTRCLQALERSGHAFSGKDKDGNLTFESTPQLLSETGKNPGPLLVRFLPYQLTH